MAFPFMHTVAVVVALCAAMNGVTSDWINDFDEPESFDCPLGQFLSHINSEHNNHNEDRHWSFGCRDVPVGNCHKTNYVNNYDEVFAYQCSGEGFVTGIESMHNNHYEDRRFKFMCCDVPGAVAHNCYFTAYQNVMDGLLDYQVPTPKILRDYVNNYDEVFAYQCSGEGFVTGIESMHNNHYEDRRFKFMCCDVPGAVAHNCYFTAYQNVMDGLLDYQVPTPKILRGVESFHSDHYEDRRFRFEICDYDIMN